MYHLFSGQSSLISKIPLSFDTNLNLFHKFMAIPIVSEPTDNFPRGGKNIFAPMILSSILSVRQILSVFYLFIYLFIIIIFNLFYLLIINLNNKIQLFLSKKNFFLIFLLLSSILMMNANIWYKFFDFILFFDRGNRPRDLGFFLTPTYGVQPSRNVVHMPHLRTFLSDRGVCPRGGVTNSSQALTGGKRRIQQREVVSPFFFLFGGSFEPLSFASLRLELINKFV